jgi:O-antigen/teichoic acid export membrane protein
MAISQAVNWGLYQTTVITGPNRPKLDFSGIQRSRCKILLGFSGNVTVMGLVDSLMQTLPAILVARLGGLAIVPIFNFSWKGPYLAAGLGKRTYQSFYPALQRLHVSGKHDAFRAKHKQVGLLAIGISLLVASGVLLVNSSVVQLLAGPEFYIGPLANMWFAVGMVSFTLTGIFRILLPISGSYGKNAVVSVMKLTISALLAWGTWHYYGLTGIAAVFALTPLITGAYAYIRGARNCGYSIRELSPSVALLGIAAIILVAITGLLVATNMSEGIVIEFGKRSITSPSFTSALLALIPSIPGCCLIAVFARNFIRNVT